ncbi:hypothetical protein V8E53_000069 [Lactarius tabidus]
MAASPVVNVSHSHSSETIIAASPSSAVHSLTSTVSGGHELIAKQAIGSPTEEAGRVLPFLPQPNTDPSLVTWDDPDDPANPQNWSFRYKSCLTGVCSLMTVAIMFASSAPSSSISDIAHEFHVSRGVGDLILTVFLIGFALGPSF